MNNYAPSGCVVLSRRDTWPISIPGYRGVCRGLWWPLREHAKADLVASRLTATLKRQFLEELGSSRPNVSTDAKLLRDYMEACVRLKVGPLFAFVCASPYPGAAPDWLVALRDECEHIGIDVSYPTGSYSFVDGDFFEENAEIFAFLKSHLNGNGLFDNIEDAEQFMRLHQTANDRGANLETLDDVTPIELWEDHDLSCLRRVLGADVGE